MRRSLAISLALGAVPQGLRAEPATPQINSLHLQREDAQRLRERQRQHDREPPAVAGATKPPPLPSAAPRPATDYTGRTAGIVLLTVAGIAGTVSIGLLANSSGDDSSDTSTATVLLIAAAVAGLSGLGLVISGSSKAPSRAVITLGPAAAPGSVGLAVTGRM